MSIINLKNITIREKEDKNSNPYYLIVDNETDRAYFCFSGAVKEGWQDLTSNWQEIKEIELEYIENERGNNKVISVFVNKESDVMV